MVELEETAIPRQRYGKETSPRYSVHMQHETKIFGQCCVELCFLRGSLQSYVTGKETAGFVEFSAWGYEGITGPPCSSGESI
jgi:hypothetical protein